jgi:predicted RND superfamily exporter protein
MFVKRLILALISIAFGVSATFGILYAIGANYAAYGFGYFFFTSLALACFLGIWLDKFMGTELLPK